jgi:hypothetical protein
MGFSYDDAAAPSTVAVTTRLPSAGGAGLEERAAN